MSRFSVFLLVAFLLGAVLLVARFKGHEKDFGGIGRYRDRGDNHAAWEPYEHHKAPSPEAFLRDFCRYGCPDTSYARKLLPDDNFRHILLSFRDPSDEHHGDPVDAYAKALHQEQDIPIQGRLDAKSTLGDVLVVLNELLGPKFRERERQDSAYKVANEAMDREQERLKTRAKDSVIYAEQARARELEERMRSARVVPVSSKLPDFDEIDEVEAE
jgi:hypothetical protein